MIGIYKITSPSGKVYIGQSKDLNKRKKDYQKYIKNSNMCGWFELGNKILKS